MPQLSDRTKKNCINQIDREYARRNETHRGGNDGEAIVDLPVPLVVKEIKKVYKSSLISDCPVIGSEEDIDKLLNNLRVELEKELEEKEEFKLV